MKKYRNIFLNFLQIAQHQVGNKGIAQVPPGTAAISFSDNIFHNGQTETMTEMVRLCRRVRKHRIRIFGILHMNQQKISFIVNGQPQKRRGIPGRDTALDPVIEQVKKETDKNRRRDLYLLWKQYLTGKCDAQICTFHFLTV